MLIVLASFLLAVWPGPAHQAQAARLCGQIVTRPPSLGANGLGPALLGTRFDSLRTQCPSWRDTIVEGMYVGLYGTFAGSTILALRQQEPSVWPDTLPRVDIVRVWGGAMSSADGIRIGATVSSIPSTVWLRAEVCQNGHIIFLVRGPRPMAVYARGASDCDPDMLPSAVPRSGLIVRGMEVYVEMD